jgi:hypothetical protein
MSRALLQQALEALTEHGTPYLHHGVDWDNAITAIRAHLANTKDVEPVAWLKHDNPGGHDQEIMCYEGHPEAYPVFRHPAPIPPGMVEELTQELNDYKERYVEQEAIRVKHDALATMTQERDAAIKEVIQWSREAGYAQARERRLREAASQALKWTQPASNAYAYPTRHHRTRQSKQAVCSGGVGGCCIRSIGQPHDRQGV